jgi:ferritin-like metal-binding protein YciE
MRDLKDYITAAKGGAKPNPGSPFNIKEDSIVLSNFSKDDIAKLFAQRTAETKQKITQEALDYVYEQSKGQPWIVNSLFKRATLRILDESSNETVTKKLIEQAREQMILARETHLDALAVRLDDPRVRKIIETLMTGEPDPTLTQSDEFRYCMDLGLVIKENGTPMVANPIYREVLARQCTQGSQDAIVKPEWQWEKADGSLDMDKLLKEFQKFWRANSEIWEQKLDYTEAFPHLLLQAFLQRVLNGGGQIDREYAAGRARMDLAVRYHGKIYIIEIKLIRDYNNAQTIKEDGLMQIAKYRDSLDPKAAAYLIIFDRRSENKKASWDERITWEQEAGGIVVVGC